MTSTSFTPTAAVWEDHPITSMLQAFPIACFTLALFTDIAYWQTANLLWLHFSEWLLLAGIVFGGLAVLAHAVALVRRRARFGWPAMLSGVVVLLLAAINNFVHTADGWTAVVPYGLLLSALTVLAMIGTAFLARAGRRHV